MPPTKQSRNATSYDGEGKKKRSSAMATVVATGQNVVPGGLDANRLAALWSTLDRALSETFEDESPSTAAIVNWLHHWAPVGVVELARVVGLTQPACTRALDKLVERGLVKRQTLSGKEVRLALTESGHSHARFLQQRRLQACAALLSVLTDSEQRTFAELTNKLLQAPVSDRAYAKNVCRFCDHAVCDGPLCPIGCRATAIERGC